ncbi:MAG: ketopantoate reductase family protein [Anaerolineaceae bacterium]|nr:ketopantoate reductase family protein [Anaerolineaceae bacterium]
MNEIHSVAILGAGAMGAYFAAQFSQAPGFSTVLVARGERLERLRREGLVVNQQRYQVPVRNPEEDGDPVDLIIVGLKYHHLTTALPDLRSLVGEETTIISVMNGLDSEEIIGAEYGMDKLLYTVSIGIDAVREGNQVTYTNAGRQVFGEARNDQISPRVRRVQRAFDRAGIAYETPADMLRMLWWKFMVNVGVNQASAVTRAPYGIFQTLPAGQALMESLMDEVVALAAARGINLTAQDVKDWYPVLNTLSPRGKTSMLQDIEAGRKTEVEMFGGKVVQLGEQLGVPTPANQAVMRIIQVLEACAG